MNASLYAKEKHKLPLLESAKYNGDFTKWSPFWIYIRRIYEDTEMEGEDFF